MNILPLPHNQSASDPQGMTRIDRATISIRATVRASGGGIAPGRSAVHSAAPLSGCTTSSPPVTFPAVALDCRVNFQASFEIA